MCLLVSSVCVFNNVHIRVYLVIGVVPVTIRPPQVSNLPASLPTIKLTLEISNVIGVLTTHTIARILKSKVGLVTSTPYISLYLSSSIHQQLLIFIPLL